MKNYQAKTKLQLIEEIKSLKNRIDELEQSELKYKQADVELQKSDNIISQSPAVVFLWKNAEGWPVEYVSRNVKDLFGYSAEEFISGEIPYESVLHPDDLGPVIEEVLIYSKVKGMTEFTQEYRIVTKVGETKWIEDHTSIRRNEKGEITHYQGIVLNITMRKQAEEELIESKQMLSNVLNTIPVRVFWKDLEGVYLGCNQLFAQDAGRSNPEEMIGDNDYNMGWADQAELYRSDDKSVIESGQPKINYEEPQTTPEGKTIWLSTSKIPLWNTRGNVYSVLGTYEDITERKQSEVALLRSEAMFKGIFSQAPVGIELYDSKGNLINANQECLNIFGVGHIEDVMGFKLFEDPNISAEAKTQLRNGESVDYESEFDFEAVKKLKLYKTTKLGKCYLRVQITPYKISDVGEKGFVVHVQDITARKKAEEKIRQQQEELQIILDSVPALVFYKDKEDRFIRVNKALAQAFNMSKEEIIGKTAAELSPVKDYWEDDKRVIETGIPLRNIIEPMKTPEGTIWAQTDKIPYKDYDGNIVGIIGFAVDITEHKQVEDALRESEEKYRLLFESIPDVITTIDEQGTIISANNSVKRILGYEPTELLGKPVEILAPEELRSEQKENIIKAINKGFLESQETIRVAKDGTRIPIDISVFTSKDSTGNLLGVSAIMRDITERKQAEEVLRENEEKLRNIVEYSTNLFYSHTPDHVLTYISPQTREFFDCEPEEALIRWTEFVTDNPINDKGLKFTEEAIKTGERQPVYEFELVGMKGRKIWVEVSEAPIVENGKTVAIVGALTDITERKQAEDTLREKDSQYRLLIETSTAGINLLDKDGNFLVVNEPAAKDWGKRPVDLINKNVKEVLPPEFADEVLNIIQKVSETGIGFEQEKFIEPLNKHFIGNIQPIFDDKKKFLGIQIMTFDITERKQAEQNIRDSEYLLRESQKVANLGSYVLDISGGIWKSSAILDDVFGIDKKYNKDIPGWLEIVHPEDQAMMQDYFAINVLTNHESFNKEYRIKRINDQQERWVLGLGVLEFNDDGNPIKMIGTIQDITERKQSEMALLKSEESLKLAQEFGKVGSWDWDILNDKLTWSDQSFIQLGLKPNEIEPTLEVLENFIHPDDRGLVSVAIEQTLKYDKPYSVETRMIKPDGKEWIMHTNGKVIRDEKGNPTRFVGVQQDITERKKAEEAHRESEERFSRLSGAAFEGIVISDAGKIIDVNDQLAKMMGYKPEEIIGKHAMEYVAPESRELVMNKIKSGTEGSYEHFALKNDGSIFPVEVQAKTLPYEGRSFRVTAIRNTTERKKAEEEIRKLSHSVEQSPAIVIITDLSANIEYVNPKFEEVTGYTAKEVIGKNTGILKSGETTTEEYEILWKTIKAGGEWHGEFHNRKKNGELYWESASISAIKDTKGQTTHYIAIKEDITERKSMDKRLRESHNRLRSLAERLQMIREEERATIAREIHDDLGQSLTALKMDISWVKNNPEMDAEAKTAKFDMMLDLTNSTIQTVKRIATELRPGILDDLGLVPAIEWQSAEFQNRFKIQCNVSKTKSDVIIKDEISIAVFRIFQETLTNVARHSGATKVDIKLNFHVDNKLIMEIADNGVGIDEEQINSPKSLGLFGMRERANILNGEMEIIGEHGKGTKVRVLIPVSIEELGNSK